MNSRLGRADLRILIDSHALVWFVRGDRRCSARAKAEIERAEAYVSAATSWEVTTKVRLGKWPGAEELIRDFDEVMRHFDFRELPISIEHGRVAGSLPGAHKDPFDRIFVAQALIEDLILVTADPAFQQFDVSVLW